MWRGRGSTTIWHNTARKLKRKVSCRKDFGSKSLMCHLPKPWPVDVSLRRSDNSGTRPVMYQPKENRRSRVGRKVQNMSNPLHNLRGSPNKVTRRRNSSAGGCNRLCHLPRVGCANVGHTNRSLQSVCPDTHRARCRIHNRRPWWRRPLARYGEVWR